jgi:phage-related protein
METEGIYFDQMTTVLVDIQSILIEIRDNLSQSLQQVNPKSQSVANPFNAVSKGLGGALKPLMSMFSKYLAPLMLIGAVMKGIVEPFQQILEPFEAIGELIGTVFYPILQPLMDRLWGMVDAVSEFMAKIEPFYPMIEYISALILDLLINVVLAKIEYIYNKIMIWLNFIMSIVKSVTDLLSGKISFGEFLAQIWNAIVTLINDLIANFISYVSNIWNSIVGTLEGFGLTLVDWFKNLPQKIVEGMTASWNALGNWWEGLWD